MFVGFAMIVANDALSLTALRTSLTVFFKSSTVKPNMPRTSSTYFLGNATGLVGYSLANISALAPRNVEP